MPLRMRVHNTCTVGAVFLILGIIASFALGSYCWAFAGVGGVLLCYAHMFGILVSLQRMQPDAETLRAVTALTEEEPEA